MADISAIRPVMLFRCNGVDDFDMASVQEGIERVLDSAGMQGSMPIIAKGDAGIFRTFHERGVSGDLPKESPIPPHYWYLPKRQVDAPSCLEALSSAVQREGNDCYSIGVLGSDMNALTPYGRTAFVVGFAEQGKGAVISTCRFDLLPLQQQYAFIMAETMRQLGRVLGMLPEERTEWIEKRYGRHCRNKCIMQPAFAIPQDWQAFAQMLDAEPFCSQCTDYMHRYFSAEPDKKLL